MENPMDPNACKRGPKLYPRICHQKRNPFLDLAKFTRNPKKIFSWNLSLFVCGYKSTTLHRKCANFRNDGKSFGFNLSSTISRRTLKTFGFLKKNPQESHQDLRTKSSTKWREKKIFHSSCRDSLFIKRRRFPSQQKKILIEPIFLSSPFEYFKLPAKERKQKVAAKNLVAQAKKKI